MLKKVLKIRLASGSLVYVMVLSLVIVLILGILILRNNYTLIEVSKIQEREKLQDNLESVITILEEDSSLLPHNKVFKISDNSDIETKIFKKPWGLLDIVYIISKGKTYRDTSIYLASSKYSKDDSLALYLSDKRNYLILGGKAKITGNVRIPKLGYKRGYINGKNCSEKVLIDGDIFFSENKLPDLNAKLLSKIYSKIPSFEISSLKDSLTNSFRKQTLKYHSKDIIKLSNINLKGNIKIESDNGIIVYPTCKLNNVILESPVIIIKSGFKGNAHFFSTHKVLLEEKVELNYPSYIVLKGLNIADCTISKDSSIKGGIVFENRNEKSVLKMQSKSYLKGQIYSRVKICLEGNLDGCAYIDQLYYDTEITKYRNVLFDCKIDRNILQLDMPLIDIEGKFRKEVFIKWLD